MKKILLVMLIMMLVGCNNEVVDDPSACSIDEPCNSEKTETINAKEGLKWDVLSLAESFDYMNKTVILFYSFEDCPYCKEARPVLEEAIDDQDIDIYYVDVSRDERIEGNDGYDRLYAYLEEELTKGGYDKVYMPTAVFIKDGDLKGIHVGTVDSHDAHEGSLNDEQHKELQNIYEELIKMLK